MTNSSPLSAAQRAELRQKAEAYAHHLDADFEFHGVCSPSVVLALLDALEAAERRIVGMQRTIDRHVAFSDAAREAMRPVARFMDASNMKMVRSSDAARTGGTQ